MFVLDRFVSADISCFSSQCSEFRIREWTMIIDCHTHISCADGNIGHDEHLAGTEGLDGCIVLAGASGASKEENKRLSEYVSRYPKKMFGFAVANPTIDNISVKNFTNIKERMKLDGAVLYPAEHKFNPTHSRAMQFYETASELSMPIFFHNSGTLSPDAVLNYANPVWIDEIAQKFGELKIVIADMGRPFLNQTLCVIGKNKNVYADLTIDPEKVWDVYNTVVSAYEADVMDKLIFGSGLPDGKPQSYIETLLGFNKLTGDTNLPRVPREKIRAIIERDSLKLLGIDY